MDSLLIVLLTFFVTQILVSRIKWFRNKSIIYLTCWTIVIIIVSIIFFVVTHGKFLGMIIIPTVFCGVILSTQQRELFNKRMFPNRRDVKDES